ncbi:MAG: SAM-dependent methyltransferase [Bacteroidota bacterium]|jgi:16S rRNA (cytidine1402-2'-O)-methyltransferase
MDFTKIVPPQNPELILFPLPIGEHSNAWMLTTEYLKEIQSITTWVAEEARTLRRFLSSLKLGINIPELTIIELNEHTSQKELELQLSQWVKINPTGKLGLCSEAGMPCIADPGNLAVKFAQARNWTLRVIPGPNSLLITLAGSGLNGQSFTFHGYPPVKEDQQKLLLSTLLKNFPKNHSHIFIEAPYRSDKFFQWLIKQFPPQTALCIGYQLHTEEEWIKTKTLADWRKMNIILGKSPCVFIIGT